MSRYKHGMPKRDTMSSTFPALALKYVFALIWLPDGSSIIAGGYNAVVGWNVVTGKVQNNYQSQEGNIQNNDQGHTGIISVACTLDSKYIASGGYDQTVQVVEQLLADDRHLSWAYRRHTARSRGRLMAGILPRQALI